MIDFNDARPQGWFSPRQLDNPLYIPELKSRLELQARSLLTHLWPAGRFVGDEFHVGSINGEKGDSLKISLRRGRVGVGADFAGNEVCGDLVDVWAYGTRGRKARGRDFAEVCEELEGFLGSPIKPRPKPIEKAQPAPALGPVTASWDYVSVDGEVLITIDRYDPPGGKKQFRQRPRMPENGRPLYNLPGIAKASTVVLVEGEKTAQTLIDRGIAATCAMGGSKVPTDKTDWTPLAGKRVVVWPDADRPGLEFAEAVRGAAEAAGATVVVMEPPVGKAEGWDAVDAIAEGLDPGELLRGFMEAPRKGPRSIDLAKWSARAHTAGEPEPIRWLIEGVIPMAAAGLLVAMGDAGKGILTLDLALKIALDKPAGGLADDGPRAFGGRVDATGTVVILAAEDDQATIHRRLHALDPDGRRLLTDRLIVVPLPNDGGPLPIVKTSSTMGPYATDEWAALKASLLAIEDLRLVVLDPLASFVHADVNADPAAGAFVTGLLASLATETGATVLVPHHMAKRQTPIVTPEDARAAIRGSTAIVDGMRFAYAMWQAEEDRGRKVCKALGVEWVRNGVFQGAVVKSNAPADRAIRTYLRSPDCGLLVDRTDGLASSRTYQREADLDELCAAIVAAAARGFPYTATGSTGVYERRGELPEGVSELGKHSLQKMVDDLLLAKRLAKVRHRGQASPWLDAPDGRFARGDVDLELGAYEA